MPYTINGNATSISSEPQMKDSTLWVPLREVSVALGAKVDWDPDNLVAIVYNGPYIYTVKVGDATVDVDGEKMELQAAPYVSEGDTWVPVRFFERPMGYDIVADWENKNVQISAPA